MNWSSCTNFGKSLNLSICKRGRDTHLTGLPVDEMSVVGKNSLQVVSAAELHALHQGLAIDKLFIDNTVPDATRNKRNEGVGSKHLPRSSH